MKFIYLLPVGNEVVVFTVIGNVVGGPVVVVVVVVVVAGT